MHWVARLASEINGLIFGLPDGEEQGFAVRKLDGREDGKCVPVLRKNKGPTGCTTLGLAEVSNDGASVPIVGAEKRYGRLASMSMLAWWIRRYVHSWCREKVWQINIHVNACMVDTSLRSHHPVRLILTVAS
jgi:hypothetical protein